MAPYLYVVFGFCMGYILRLIIGDTQQERIYKAQQERADYWFEAYNDLRREMDGDYWWKQSVERHFD